MVMRPFLFQGYSTRMIPLLNCLGRLLGGKMKMEKLGSALLFVLKLLPAAVIFVLFFSFEGNLRWLGLLGFIPLALVFCKGCTACMEEPDKSDSENGWQQDIRP